MNGVRRQRRDERQQHAQSTNSGSSKPDEELLKLIKLRDARLAKNARVEYINGEKYEWSPGNVAGQRNSSLSSTFAPTPNFYDVLNDAVCTPPVQRSAGPKINREQEKALVVTSPLNDPNLMWTQALAKPKNSSVTRMTQPKGPCRPVSIAGKRNITPKQWRHRGVG